MAQVAQIWRHPIKSHGRERLDRAELAEDRCLPWDRRWAVAHEKSRFDAEKPGWVPYNNFSVGAKAPQLQAISARSDIEAGRIALSHPTLGALTIDPDNPEDAAAFIEWVLPICPENRALPERLVRAPDRGMTDTDYPSLSLINLASHAAVASWLGKDISPLRWRGNLLIEGLSAWEEMDLVGRRIRIGDAEVKIVEPIERCLATTASTRTGERDANTLGALKAGWGHQFMGVYAVVTRPGEIGDGAAVVLP